MFFKVILQVIEEVKMSLFETIQGLVKLQNISGVWIIWIGVLKTFRLVDVDFLRKISVNKDGGDVGLSLFEAKDGGEDHQETDGLPLNYRRPCFKVVNPFFLTITTGAEPSLELLDSPIWIAFAFKGPGGGKDVHGRFIADEFPATKHFLKSDEFFNGSIVVVGCIFTRHSLRAGWIVLRIATSFG